ncbi:MAG: superoxide dismutase, Ni [Acidimicrobiales bacterium]
MRILPRLLELADRARPPWTASAHCDLPCGVYDPAQARIEAESVQKIIEKFHASSDEDFRQRCLIIKEHRADLVKHHLWVLWTDYFKPEHLQQFPELHDLFWRATKAAGQTKQTTDPANAERLLELIDEIATVFTKTKQS